MFIVTPRELITAPAEPDVLLQGNIALRWSAGLRASDNYKHLVPPGPGSSNTLLPYYSKFFCVDIFLQYSENDAQPLAQA